MSIVTELYQNITISQNAINQKLAEINLTLSELNRLGGEVQRLLGGSPTGTDKKMLSKLNETVKELQKTKQTRESAKTDLERVKRTL